MRRLVIGLVLGVALGGGIAWRVEAGDATRTIDERVALLEAKVAEHDARLAKIPAAPAVPLPPVPVAPSKPSAPPAVDPNTVTVYATASGAKYHGAGCSYLRSSGTPITLAEALRRGLTPCSRCGER